MTWGWDFSTINPTLERGLDSLRKLGGWDPRTWFQSWFPRPGVVKHPFQTVPFLWLRKWGWSDPLSGEVKHGPPPILLRNSSPPNFFLIHHCESARLINLPPLTYPPVVTILINAVHLKNAGLSLVGWRLVSSFPPQKQTKAARFDRDHWITHFGGSKNVQIVPCLGWCHLNPALGKCLG